MESNTSSPGPFDPTTQTFFVLAADGKTRIPVNAAAVTKIITVGSSLAILYGTQIGACIVMLAVVLAMTPRTRFRRLPTIISIAALVVNMLRMVFLAWFTTSTWVNFYTLVSGDPSPVSRSDYNASAAGTVLSIPATILILAALMVQAWSMLSLWPALYKLPAALLSLALVLATIAFNFAVTVLQTRGILDPSFEPRLVHLVWVRQAYLGLITASICWFCFLFNVRLVMHMWTNRSILPSLRGLKAMDVLVITNGILMFVPVVFSALEFQQWDNFESASLTQTSVIIVLPLGTLVAQRLANPAWFGTGAASSSGPGGSGCSGSGIGGGGPNSLSSGTTTITTTTAGGGGPGSAVSTINSSAAKRPLLKKVRSGGGFGGGVHRGGGAVTTHIASDGLAESEKSHRAGRSREDDAYVDLELARIADGDLERGHLGRHGGGGGVRVDYGIERREERVRTDGS